MDRGRDRLPLRPQRGLRAPGARPPNSPRRRRPSFDALRTEYERLEDEHAGADELPEEVDQRLGEIETALAAFDDRAVSYDPADIARAGVFVSIDAEGALRIERGYVRPRG